MWPVTFFSCVVLCVLWEGEIHDILELKYCSLLILEI